MIGNRQKHRFCSLALVMLVVFASIAGILQVLAYTSDEATKTVHLSTVGDLVDLASLAKESRNFDGWTIYLDADITIKESDYETYSFLRTDHYLTIGNRDNPFMGHFDGRGHSITGLNNVKGTLPEFNHALFGATQGATIENLILTDAKVHSDYTDGILVGEAKSSTIRNIIINGYSELKVEPANNIVSLVTNLGTNGGAIAGSAEDTYFYNCESNNTTIYNNTTSGVSGVGGERLVLGGIVGDASRCVVEYCRVLGGNIENKYDVAVGAVGGKQIFVGGLVGEARDVNVIDSFSTANLYYYAANYVSVGSGIAGYIGGLIGLVNGDGNEVIRSHFSGTMSSEQVNSVLVLPVIIQKDVNLYGLAGRHFSDANLKTEHVFFNCSDYPDTTAVSFENDYHPTNTRGLTDSEFLNKTYFADCGYDFQGNVARTTVQFLPDISAGMTHYNRWVMDTELGYPVHGHAVAATFDFPNAAKVTLTNLQSRSEDSVLYPYFKAPVSTEQWNRFAVQGIRPGQETNVEVKTETKATAEGFDAAMDGGVPPFRFLGWYKQENVESDSTNGKLAITPPQVSADTSFSTLSTSNDLFVAHYEGLVTFHDVNGNLISAADGTAQTSVGENDYYEYLDVLPTVRPAVTPEGCIFYGWTTIPNDRAQKGYNGIDSVTLEQIKDEIYYGGEQITKPMQLYPIYTNFLTNVVVQVEGYDVECPGNTNKTLRPNADNSANVAWVSIAEDNGKVTLQLNKDANGNYVELPAGYRWLGWYEINENGVGQLISQDKDHTLRNVDLSKVHTYEARFEYEVKYWVYVDNIETDIYTGETPYLVIWQTFDTPFKDEKDVPGPNLYRAKVHHWALGDGNNLNPDNYKIPDGEEEPTCGSTDKLSGDYKIKKPLDAYAHLQRFSGNYEVNITDDFPNAGYITTSGSGASHLTFHSATVNSGYNFIGMNFDGSLISHKRKTTENQLDVGTIGTTTQYTLVAHYTANVAFHFDTGVDKTVDRRYGEMVFLTADSTYEYKYYHNSDDGTDISHTSYAISFPEARLNAADTVVPYRAGYTFLGWVNKTAMSEQELALVFDVAGDEFATSSAVNAAPYLLNGMEKVYEPMDLYAVYVKNNTIVTTNNILEAVGETDPQGIINVPERPDYTWSSVDREGYSTITLTADISKTVLVQDNGDATATQYSVLHMDMVDANGKVTRQYPDAAGDSTFQFSDVVQGQNYTFIAYYEPVVIVYHTNEPDKENPFHAEIRNTGDQVGLAPDALFDPQNAVFLGWTEAKPIGSYHIGAYTEVSTLPLVSSADYVNGAMEMWAVYAQIGIQVNSNIDALISDEATLRFYQKNSNGVYSINAQRYKTVGADTYEFVGWYTDYADDSDLGTQFSTGLVARVDDVFTNRLYTAVYMKVEPLVEVAYYSIPGADGNVEPIYGVKVKKGARAYVQKGADNSESMIDYPAYFNLMQDLDPQHQVFRQFRWDNNGTFVDWNEFKNEPIVQNMNLYPEIWNIHATDSRGNELTYGTDYTVRVDEDGTVNIYLVKDYEDTKLVVKVTEIENNEATEKAVVDTPVKVYGNVTGNTDEEIEIGSANTDANGVAEFNFIAKLKLQKLVRNADGSLDTANQDVFLVTIIKGIKQEDGTYLHSTEASDRITLSIQANAQATVLELHYGVYFIEEDMTFAYKYQTAATFAVNGTETASAQITVGRPNAEVIIYNTSAAGGDKWLGSGDFAHNVFQ